MKLAEALLLRADCLRRIRELQERLFAVIQIQEGDEPAESPQDLIGQLERVMDKFARLVKQINKTNSMTFFSEGQTLTDTLAERDSLAMKRKLYEHVMEQTRISRDRFGRSEIKFVITVKVQEIHQQQDRLAKAYRELDARIQQFNWMVDLLE